MKALATAAHHPVLDTVAHRPYALPRGPWRMRQRWNDLLFAHWPLDPARVAPLLPRGLELDTFNGAAWLGVVPFTMSHVQTRLAGSLALGLPTVSRFAELNLRTYVRSPRTGLHGVYFFSLDCASLLATLGARTLFHLPYFYARMRVGESAEGIHYRSFRRFARRPVGFDATYRALPGAVCAHSLPDTLGHFLTERYCLFTPHRGRILRGDIHHLPWSLADAEAHLQRNDLAAAQGLTLPGTPPVLQFSRALEVYIWPLVEDTATRTRAGTGLRRMLNS